MEFKILSSLNIGLYECEDPSTNSRNVSLEEFTKQVKNDNVST